MAGWVIVVLIVGTAWLLTRPAHRRAPVPVDDPSGDENRRTDPAPVNWTSSADPGAYLPPALAATGGPAPLT
jgi:hypothetical protein